MNGFQQITEVVGFNYMATDLGRVAPNTEIFLRQQNGNMLSLGTVAQAAARAPFGTTHVIGVNGALLGNFNTPQIQNNLFIRLPPPMSAPRAGPNGGRRIRRSTRKYGAKRSRRSRKARRSRRR
jgi:hypothetical protein